MGLCGMQVFGAIVVSPVLGLVSGFIAARVFTDRRGPVRYVVTPVRGR